MFAGANVVCGSDRNSGAVAPTGGCYSKASSGQPQEHQNASALGTQCQRSWHQRLVLRPRNAAATHRTAVVECQLVLPHCAPNVVIVGVGSGYPKLVPRTAAYRLPDIGTFVKLRYGVFPPSSLLMLSEATSMELVRGASNVNKAPVDVPTIRPTVIATDVDSMFMLAPDAHASVVALIHAVVWQPPLASLAVGELYIMPNDSPVTVTLVPPLVATLSVLPRVALTTGAS